MLMLFKDILNEHNPYTNSYHEIIKAESFICCSMISSESAAYKR